MHVRGCGHDMSRWRNSSSAPEPDITGKSTHARPSMQLTEPPHLHLRPPSQCLRRTRHRRRRACQQPCTALRSHVLQHVYPKPCLHALAGAAVAPAPLAPSQRHRQAPQRRRRARPHRHARLRRCCRSSSSLTASASESASSPSGSACSPVHNASCQQTCGGRRVPRCRHVHPQEPYCDG